MYDRNKAW
jgi:hypothetical protein